MTNIDLHLHTAYSDGEFYCTDLIDKLKKQNISILSITDHNTIAFYEKQQEYISKENKIKFILGSEITAYSRYGKIHILAYDFDMKNSDMQYLLKTIRTNEQYKVFQIIKLLQKMEGLKINIKEFEKDYSTSNCYNFVHLAEYLWKHNMAVNLNHGFKIINKYGKNDIIKIRPEEIIEIIRAANGIPVLAHPITLKESEQDLKNTILYFKSYGLLGIEGYHSIQNEEYTKFLLNLAENAELFVSAGSDYHGNIFSPNLPLAGINEFSYFDIKNVTILDEFKRRKLI